MCVCLWVYLCVYIHEKETQTVRYEFSFPFVWAAVSIFLGCLTSELAAAGNELNAQLWSDNEHADDDDETTPAAVTSYHD